MGYVGVKPSAVPLTSADITDGIITSAKIADGTIVNADINASAAIVGTKLSGINDAKAWVNFNGTGTVAIRGSGNVTSITDNGTGDYTINFTTALTDANYAPVVGMRRGTSNNDLRITFPNSGTFSTTQLRVLSEAASVADTAIDAEIVSVAVFR